RKPGFAGTTNPCVICAADNVPHGLAVGSECRSSPRPQTSLVAYCSCPVRAAITTPVEPLAVFLVRFTRGIGLPRYLWRVGFHIDAFEACSMFTRVTARTAR